MNALNLFNSQIAEITIAYCDLKDESGKAMGAKGVINNFEEFHQQGQNFKMIARLQRLREVMGKASKQQQRKKKQERN
jgi:hypothetical protein